MESVNNILILEQASALTGVRWVINFEYREKIIVSKDSGGRKQGYESPAG